MLSTITDRLPLYRIHDGTFHDHVANSTDGRDCYKDEVCVGETLQVRSNINGVGPTSGNCFDYGKYGTDGVRVEARGSWDGMRVQVQPNGDLLIGGKDAAVTVPMQGIQVTPALALGDQPITSVCVQRSRVGSWNQVASYWENKAFLTVNGNQTWLLGEGQATPVQPRGSVSTFFNGLEWYRYDQQVILGAKTFVDRPE